MGERAGSLRRPRCVSFSGLAGAARRASAKKKPADDTEELVLSSGPPQETTAPLVQQPRGMLPDDSPSMDAATRDTGGGGGVEATPPRGVWVGGRRAMLNRAISLTVGETYLNGGRGRGAGVWDGPVDAAAAAARLNRTSSPATKARWKHARSTRSNRLTLLRGRGSRRTSAADEAEAEAAAGDPLRLQLGTSPPVDDDLAPLFESLERTETEELRVRVCRDSVMQGLREAARATASGCALLDAVERGELQADSALDTFAGKSPLELNLLLLWSALLRRRDLLSPLLKAGAQLDFCDPDGLSALHLAAFGGCADCCRFLLSMGADPNLLRGMFTPLHSAAFGNATEAARALLDAGAVVEYWKRCGGIAGGLGCGDGSALHAAIKANAPDVLRLLLEHCDDVNTTQPDGCAPLHLAADLGTLDCLRVLVEWPGIDLDVQTGEKRATALHLAAENGLSDCVSLLLSKGADAGVCNARGQLPLHLAARAQSVECVETLLRNSGSCDVNATDLDQRTPLHAAVGKALQAYEVAETLLAWRADPNACDRYGYTPLHMAALNELAQCVETLLHHGADVTARTRGGSTALAIIVRKTPAAVNTLYRKLDNAISMHDPEVSHREVELCLDFRNLLQHSHHGEISYLKTIVDEGQKELLKHPLCDAFLHLKWAKIRKFYLVKLLFCFFFVSSLSLYVMVALAHDCYNEYSNVTESIPSAVNVSLENVSLPKQSETNKTNSTNKLCDGFGLVLKGHPEIIDYIWFILFLFTICEFFRKLFGLFGFSSIGEYVSQVENIFEWFVLFSVFAISCVFSDSISIWQNHIGAFAVLLGWWNLMHMLGQLPLFGPYVAMYSRVQSEFLKLFLAYFCLLVGFAISFCVIFPEKPQFANPWVSFLKVLVMMTGELEFDNIFFQDKEQIKLKWSADFIFVIFLLFVTVVLMNLLVGIAVHDIQGLQKTADLQKLEQQTRLISYVELALFNAYVPNYLLKILQSAAMISPSAYRVVLHVKPLNPREKRLPRDILHTAYELAKQCKQKKHGSTIASRFSNATATFSDGTLYSKAGHENVASGAGSENKIVIKLSEDLCHLKSVVEKQQTMIKEILDLVKKKEKESEC